MRKALLAALLLTLAPALAFAITLNLEYPSFGGFDINNSSQQDIGSVVAWFYYLVVGISGFAAFAMLIWGGIEWLSSAGNPGRIQNAKDRIQQALLGLLLVLGSFVILQVINPELTILRTPALKALSATPPGILTEEDLALFNLLAQSDCGSKSPASSLTSSDPFGSPAEGTINDVFGYRGIVYENGVAITKNPCHTGIDIAGNNLKPVRATAAGTLIAYPNDASIGNYVLIGHGTYNTLYAHLKRFESGIRIDGAPQSVLKGQVIGYVGQSGAAQTGPHLHYEIKGAGYSGLYNPNSAVWGVCGSQTCQPGLQAVPVQ